MLHGTLLKVGCMHRRRLALILRFLVAIVMFSRYFDEFLGCDVMYSFLLVNNYNQFHAARTCPSSPFIVENDFFEFHNVK